MADDLHTRLREAITARQERAKVCSSLPVNPDRPYDWFYSETRRDVHDALGVPVATDTSEADGRFIAAENPAFVLAQCDRDLKVLERHHRLPPHVPDAVDGDGQPHAGVCDWCEPGRRHWPCVEIAGLAAAYGLTPEGDTTP